MKNTIKKIFRVILMLSLLLPGVLSFEETHAEEVKKYESNGSITFYGTYDEEPENSEAPESSEAPKAPSESKPTGKLPQTGESQLVKAGMMGVVVLGGVLLVLTYRLKRTKKGDRS